MEQNKNDARLVFLSRRAYETGRIHLVFFQDQVWDTRDTGWQLLEGSETGLELANPGNSLLVSVTRALELEPRLQSLLLHDAPEEAAAFRWDAAAGEYRPTQLPEDIPTQ
ncbi:hypothetical protein [Ruminococcus sp.]|uniref:hypothetical protein n=1 Tax=Ruminococcus sp. TaxID=41978 RepID=UPI0026325D35|nr:hypothetical protein [Ruminococcus sp.]MEE0023868.1 hypothetical protein [Ruminococcus sp.]